MSRARGNLRRLGLRPVLVLVVVLALFAVRAALDPQRPNSPPEPTGATSVEQAYEGQLSEIMVVAAGHVQRLLPDDEDGSRHQRFILALPSGHTVLVAHNIDLARRVPAADGDKITVHGQYEWNERGGVIHWTHHDPAGRRAGGWIEHNRERYR